MITILRLPFILLSIFIIGCTWVPITLSFADPNLCKKSISPPPKKIGVKYLQTNKQISVTCQPLILTDLRLPQGEIILSVNSGDTSRWLFQTIISNEEGSSVSHLLIKPKEVDIKTNLVLVTNKHVYHIFLSAKNKAINTYYSLLESNETVTPSISLDECYEIKIPYFQKKPSWTPSKVYNDGSHVYIEIPNHSIDSTPTFYVLDDSNQPLIVNYHIENNLFKIDQLFSRGLLVQGVGTYQNKVMIEHSEKSEEKNG